MAKPVAHGDELVDCPVQLVCLGGQLLPVYLRSIGGKHACDLFKRETCILAQGDQRQAVQHVCVIYPAQTIATYRLDKPLVFVKSQC